MVVPTLGPKLEAIEKASRDQEDAATVMADITEMLKYTVPCDFAKTAQGFYEFANVVELLRGRSSQEERPYQRQRLF